MSLPTVRPGDVYRLPVPGDNGETKMRFSVILDSYPSISAPKIVAFIFGCSETKRGAKLSRFVRIETTDRAAFNAIRLENGTTFHYEDIRLYDASSDRLVRKHGSCPQHVFQDLRTLYDIYRDENETILLLPERASEAAKAAASDFAAGAKKS